MKTTKTSLKSPRSSCRAGTGLLGGLRFISGSSFGLTANLDIPKSSDPSKYPLKPTSLLGRVSLTVLDANLKVGRLKLGVPVLPALRRAQFSNATHGRIRTEWTGAERNYIMLDLIDLTMNHHLPPLLPNN